MTVRKLSVDVSKCGSVDGALRKLKRILDKNGNQKRWRELEHRVKPSEERRHAKAAQRRRNLKKRFKEALMMASKKRRTRR